MRKGRQGKKSVTFFEKFENQPIAAATKVRDWTL